MKLEANTCVWVWDTGRWLVADVVDPGQQFTRVRLENGVSVTIATRDIAVRDANSGRADKPRPPKHAFK